MAPVLPVWGGAPSMTLVSFSVVLVTVNYGAAPLTAGADGASAAGVGRAPSMTLVSFSVE